MGRRAEGLFLAAVSASRGHKLNLQDCFWWWWLRKMDLQLFQLHDYRLAHLSSVNLQTPRPDLNPALIFHKLENYRLILVCSKHGRL
jgi:hypothetical protein